MQEHHRQSVENLINYFRDDRDIIAVILGGSVAKGCERADSDIDAVVVVKDAKYNKLSNEKRLSECIHGHCTYEGGYFDIKYCTKAYLNAAAKRGSEPTRNAFQCSRAVYCTDGEIPKIVAQIPVFQKQEKEDKLLSFFSALALNSGYFWGASENDIYLRSRVAADVVLFGFRLLLQENEVLFPCHKGLLKAVAALGNKPHNITEKAERFLALHSNETKEDFVHAILDFIAYKPPADYSEVLSRFVDDNELWWYKERPTIAEW